MRWTLLLLALLGLGLGLGGCIVVERDAPGNSGNAPGHLKH